MDWSPNTQIAKQKNRSYQKTGTWKILPTSNTCSNCHIVAVNLWLRVKPRMNNVPSSRCRQNKSLVMLHLTQYFHHIIWNQKVFFLSLEWERNFINENERKFLNMMENFNESDQSIYCLWKNSQTWTNWRQVWCPL